MPIEITGAREITRPGGARVAANPVDRWVLALEYVNDKGVDISRIVVVTRDGGVFAHDINGAIGDPYQLTGPAVGAQPQDRWVLRGRPVVVGFTGDGVAVLRHRIIVITAEGRVFAHELGARTVKPAFPLTGPPVAARPEDKLVFNMFSEQADSRLLVVTTGGGVFAHDLQGETISPAHPLTGPAVAARPEDKWVVDSAGHLLAITSDGRVFAHAIRQQSVQDAVQVQAPPVAARPEDKWVLNTLRGGLLPVITQDGRVFVHTVLE